MGHLITKHEADVERIIELWNLATYYWGATTVPDKKHTGNELRHEFFERLDNILTDVSQMRLLVADAERRANTAEGEARHWRRRWEALQRDRLGVWARLRGHSEHDDCKEYHP